MKNRGGAYMRLESRSKKTPMQIEACLRKHEGKQAETKTYQSPLLHPVVLLTQ